MSGDFINQKARLGALGGINHEKEDDFEEAFITKTIKKSGFLSEILHFNLNILIFGIEIIGQPTLDTFLFASRSFNERNLLQHG